MVMFAYMSVWSENKNLNTCILRIFSLFLIICRDSKPRWWHWKWRIKSSWRLENLVGKGLKDICWRY